MEDENRKGILCLTRRQGDAVLIGEEIWIKISRVRGGNVRLVICAPKHMKVHRKENWELEYGRKFNDIED